MLARIFYSIGAVSGGAVLSQFPEYYAHYVQRLGGRIDQARLRAEAIREDAAEKGLSVKAYIETFLRSEPHDLEGRRMTESIFQLDGMEAAYQALRQAPTLERPLVFGQQMDPALAESTLRDFVPAVPLSPEGMVYAGCGALLGLAICSGTRRMVRRRRRRREMEA